MKNPKIFGWGEMGYCSQEKWFPGLSWNNIYTKRCKLARPSRDVVMTQALSVALEMINIRGISHKRGMNVQ